MKTVKSNQQLKSIWSATGPHPPDMYHALLFKLSLSKAILLQAETEATAEKRSAGPLAEVTASLLHRLPTYSYILFAKLVQRAGGWAVPCVMPQREDGQPWKDEDERLKAMRYRNSGGGRDAAGLESTGEYVARVTWVYSAMRRASGLCWAEPYPGCVSTSTARIIKPK
jgi:nucleoporin GLE1